MPHSSLPTRPNLEHLRNQAKDLLRAYKSGDPSALARFRESISHYSSLTDDALVRLSLSLGDAQRVAATEYGFANWLHMRRYVERKDGSNLIEMTVDHIRVNNVTNLRTVVLKEKESERYLPIWIGQAEGDAIAMRLEGQEVPRPMTHGIMDTMIRDLGGEVEYVVVSDLVDDTFFAVVKVKNGDGAIEFDTRPSDAIALAVNSGAQVFAAPDVLDKAGAKLDPETGEFSPLRQDSEEFARRHDERHLSERFRGILEVAGMSARGMSRYEIEPEDLLLALVNDADCAAAKSLVELGADLEQIGERLRSEAESGEYSMAFSSRSLKALEAARSEASTSGGAIIGTQHLLKGLVTADDGLASAILKESGVAAGAAHARTGAQEKRGQEAETED